MGHSSRGITAIIPIRYLLVIWLLVFSAVAFLDRTNISIAGIQIGKEFSMDHTRLGWVFSAFLIGYAVFQVPAGLIVQRYGSRLVLTVAALWWGVFTVLIAVVPPGIGGAIAILILVRFALGAGEATMYPATSQFVEHWFPARERGKANGIIFGGVGLGSGITPPIVTAIILHYGWRASFWFSAGLGIVVGAVWYTAARDRPAQHPLVRATELALTQPDSASGRKTVAAASSRSEVKRHVPWSRILKSKEILCLTLSYFSFGYVAWIFFAWFYIYLAEVRGLNLKSSALYSTLPFVAMTIGCLFGGVLSDWIAERFSVRLGRCIIPACCMTITAILLVFGSRASGAVTASLLLAAGAGILYVGQNCFWAVTADVAGEHTGVASGMMNMGAQVGGACTASVTPVIAAHFGWNMSFFVAASLALLGALAWLFVDPRRTLSLAPSPNESIPITS